MTHVSRGELVVGVDDSPESVNAATYAVDQARAFNYAVSLVHGYGPPIRYGRYGAMNLDREQSRAESLVAGVASRVALPAGVTLHSAVYCRSPVDAILHAAGEAAYVVVGHRDRRPRPQLIGGSVASRLAGKAELPVVAVPGTWSGSHLGSRPVVVALDGETPAHWPLSFAFHHADVMGTTLVVLHAIPTRHTGDGTIDESTISQALAEWRARYPGIDVLIRFVDGETVETLTDASLDAGLVVVGKPHEYPWFGLWLGSTARAVLKRSACPLAIVPQTVDDTLRVMPAPSRPSSRPRERPWG